MTTLVANSASMQSYGKGFLEMSLASITKLYFRGILADRLFPMSNHRRESVTGV